MQLYLTARHIELTDALRTHVERHLTEAVEHHANVRPTRMEVQLYRTGERDIRFGCHVLLELAQRHDINIREEDRDMYAAIDLAQNRLLRAVTDYRDRLLTESRHVRKYSFERLTRVLRRGTRSAEHRKKRPGGPSL